jgi:hypothetical protein
MVVLRKTPVASRSYCSRSKTLADEYAQCMVRLGLRAEDTCNIEDDVFSAFKQKCDFGRLRRLAR